MKLGAWRAMADESDTAAAPHHLLIFPWPYQGHLNPMLQLALRLHSIGFSITFFHAQRSSPSSKPPFRLVSVDDGIPASLTHRPSPAQFHESVDRLQHALSQLLAGLRDDGSPVSCIISDNFLSWTQDVADKFGIPRVEFWTSCATSYSIGFHTPLLISKGYLPVRANGKIDVEADDPLITCIPGLPPLHLSDIPEEMRCNDIAHPLFRFFTAPFERSREAACVLVNSFYELESSVIDALKVEKLPILPVGPLFPSEFWDSRGGERETEIVSHEDDKCILWLNKQAPSSVLYASFGTIGGMDVNEMKELALGLEASRHPFIWVMRPARGTTASVMDILPDGFASRTEEQGLLVSWAPQIPVLSHPSVGGFLTHCGWNSIIESICTGVPMLGWPRRAEQKINMRMIEEYWKVGRSVGMEAGGEVSKEAVEKAVRLLMEGEEGREVRGRAEELRIAAKMAVCDGGSSVRSLELLAQEIKQLKRREQQPSS